MARMIDIVKQKRGTVLLPIFITCDPARDTPEVVKSYLAEFHPDLIGLTGTWEQIKATCKQYRVYFSTPPHVKPGQDYLVDHSIYFYLMGTFSSVLFNLHQVNARRSRGRFHRGGRATTHRDPGSENHFGSHW